jgi:hypothetical protein
VAPFPRSRARHAAARTGRHSSLAITVDIYSHVGPTLQREAADRLDQALRW